MLILLGKVQMKVRDEGYRESDIEIGREADSLME